MYRILRRETYKRPLGLTLLILKHDLEEVSRDVLAS
jgi:hypothetical protein